MSAPYGVEGSSRHALSRWPWAGLPCGPPSHRAQGVPRGTSGPHCTHWYKAFASVRPSLFPHSNGLFFCLPSIGNAQGREADSSSVSSFPRGHPTAGLGRGCSWASTRGLLWRCGQGLHHPRPQRACRGQDLGPGFQPGTPTQDVGVPTCVCFLSPLSLTGGFPCHLLSSDMMWVRCRKRALF